MSDSLSGGKERPFVVFEGLEVKGPLNPRCQFTFTEKRLAVVNVGIATNYLVIDRNAFHPPEPSDSKELDEAISRNARSLSLGYDEIEAISFSKHNYLLSPTGKLLHLAFVKEGKKQSGKYMISQAQLADLAATLPQIVQLLGKVKFP